MAQIICLTGRANKSALETTAPSSLRYDEGAHFHCLALQSCKKSARIKLLADNTFGDKTLLVIQTNCIIKAVIDKKLQKDS
jgi:hypothetical protein